MKSKLLEDVTEQKERANLVIDSDSILFLSCYALKDTGDYEAMYVDFWMRIKTIEQKVWEDYELDKIVIALTSKLNFRHGLTEKWKANRKDKDEKELTEKQIEAQREARQLKDLVKEVKGLIYKRMSKAKNRTVSANNICEADDTCIDLAHQGWLVASIDSDIIKQSPSPVFDFHKKRYRWTEGNSYEDIFYSIIHETITGGHNGKFGVAGKGKVFADKFIKQIKDGSKSLVDWVDLFPTPEEAVLNFQLIDCNQVKNNKLYLQTMESISDMFEEVVGDVF